MNLKNILYIIIIAILLAGCQDKPVEAVFNASSDVVDKGDTVYFTNLSVNANYYQWDFGDGDKSFEQDPYHVFDDTGIFKVKLKAIGEGNSDEVADTITVEQTYEVTIYEGQGIKGVSVYDTWSGIQMEFAGSDTAHYIDFYEDYGIYYHIVYYYNEGIGFSFLSAANEIANDQTVYMIFLFSPYGGATESGIIIGSAMTEVQEVYGTPEITQGDWYTGYWYTDQGIDFYTYATGVVDEIDVYATESFSSSTTKKSAMLKSTHNKLRAEGFFSKRK